MKKNQDKKIVVVAVLVHVASETIMDQKEILVDEAAFDALEIIPSLSELIRSKEDKRPVINFNCDGDEETTQFVGLDAKDYRHFTKKPTLDIEAFGKYIEARRQ